MTRIYTNVPAMTALKTLNQNMSGLQTSLQRLSTGLKINSGKDDPAGLMASEMLRSEITGVETGIKNTERANMMIAVADSALNEVSNLLNDIRGLVTEAANTGAMSREMIEANQLQVDASLKAIDRIAASTSFMGRNLLDGSLDFETSMVDRYNIQDLTIQEVRFGTDKQPVNVSLKVNAAAKRAELYYNHSVLPEDITLSFGGNLGYATESFKKGTTVQEIATVINRQTSSTGVVAEVASDAIAGQLYVSSLGPGNDIIIQAGQTGADAGCVDIKFHKGDSEGIKVDYTPSLGSGYPATLNVYLQTGEWKSAVADDVDNTVYTATGKPYHDNTALKFTANITGAQYNNTSIHYVDGRKTQENFSGANNPTGTGNTPYAYYNEEATKATALIGGINGNTALTGLGANDYLKVTANAAGSEYNNTQIRFVAGTVGTSIPAGQRAQAVYSEEDGVLQVYVDTAAGATYADIRDALNREGKFSIEFSDNSQAANPPVAGTIAATAVAAANLYDPTTSPNAAGQGNTQNSGGDAGTLFVVMDPNNPITAEQVKNIFDLDNPASRGSEKAASLFTVDMTADNTGDGLIRLYGHASDPADVSRKTAFKNVFTGGQTGGEVISTANDVVTALNNSEYWGTSMCKELLERLKIDNANGKYYDATDPPAILARLAPGEHGLGIVSPFDEVAYYGSPDDGTGLQFLGPEGSPNIRFVVDAKGNDEIWIDKTTEPDVVDYATAVLNAANPNASVVLTARKKGEQYDDILFQIKKATDEMIAGQPNRKDGWVEYDPGESYAEAEMVFYQAGSSNVVPNTAFTVTANERGAMANDTPIAMKAVPDQAERVLVTYNSITGGIDISLNSGLLSLADATAAGTTPIDTNEIIAAINAANLGFTAALSQSNPGDWNQAANLSGVNNGTGLFDTIGLTTQPTTVGNTSDTGGHKGTVTIWMTNDEVGATQTAPTANDLIRLINSDPVVGQMFTASNYANTPDAGTGAINFIHDGPLVSDGGLVERGVLIVHLQTDKGGNPSTTARDLVEWWNKQDPELVDHISASLLRRPTDTWDECNDDGGFGILGTTVKEDICDIIFDDISFVGWGDDCDEPYNYVANYSRGEITSENGINATYDLVAKRPGPEYDGYKITYVQDNSVTGRFADNIITTTKVDECGNLVTPTSMTRDGIYLELDERTKEIMIHINQGTTTAYDIKQLIENDPLTKLKFGVELKGPSEGGNGKGDGFVSVDDDSLVTKGGALPPGALNGAKLLFGKDEEEWQLVFRSEGYGSRQFVDIQGIITNGKGATLDTRLADGSKAERSYGTDTDMTINGVKAVADGLNVSTVDSTLSLSFVLNADTPDGYETNFQIIGGGATFQLGPDVVSNQQVTIGIQAINTVKLGGPSGRLYQLAKGKDADLFTDTNKAYRIVEEAIVAITGIRGRFGALQKTTLDTNANVLADTLEALVSAESQIRDADFAVETANLTRSQVLVQSNINTLGIANQIPNYMLGLLG